MQNQPRLGYSYFPALFAGQVFYVVFWLVHGVTYVCLLWLDIVIALVLVFDTQLKTAVLNHIIKRAYPLCERITNDLINPHRRKLSCTTYRIALLWIISRQVHMLGEETSPSSPTRTWADGGSIANYRARNFAGWTTEDSTGSREDGARTKERGA